MLFTHLHSLSVLVLFSLWRGGLTLPVTNKEAISDKCVFYARALLDNITDLLTQDNQPLNKNLFKGIDCTKQSVELNTNTDTPSVCAPHGTSCSGESKSHFDEELCVRSIGDDLHYYYTFLSSQPDPDRLLSSTLLLTLKELMMGCFSWTLPEGFNESISENQSSYDERLSLCKELKGFQIRSITINRALGYMRSGEHTK